MDSEKSWRNQAAELLILSGVWMTVAGLVLPFCVVGWQCFEWLKYGVWLPLNAGILWMYAFGEYIEFKWLGVTRIYIWCMENIPLSLTPLLLVPIGGIVAVYGNKLMTYPERQTDRNDF